MKAGHTSEPAEGETHLTFETAAAHATPRVPVAGPFQRVGDVRQLLVGQRYESATHIVVCEAETFLGIVAIEDLLSAATDAQMESLMDRGAPVVAPSIDQEVAAWRAVRHGQSALAVVDGQGHFVGVIPPHRLLTVLLSEHEEDLSRSAGFLKTTSVARATSEERVPRRFQHRLPWLLLGLGGALLAADLVGAHSRLTCNSTCC
jgi:magnesium transporter